MYHESDGVIVANKATTQVASDLQKKFYRQMLFYRRFEERVNIAYSQQKFSGFCHLHIGQEALCVGLQETLHDDDYVISGYRSHTQALAKGVSAEEVFGELLGKESGCSKGRGGSMHMFSARKRFFGGHGIVGGQAPIAAGIGFKIRYSEEDSICVCYLGDAAMNQGQVFEALNMAATWNLPVLFVIENNRYGMGTAISRTTKIDRLADRALGIGMKSEQIDGMNVIDVYQSITPLVAELRATSSPILVEALTYRYKGHSVSDPASYRSKEEVKRYQELDPLVQLRDEMLGADLIDEDTLNTWDKECRSTIKEALRAAEEEDDPAVADLHRYVYTEEGSK